MTRKVKVFCKIAIAFNVVNWSYLDAIHGGVEFFGLFRVPRIHGEGKLSLDEPRADLRHPDVVLAQGTYLE